MHHVEIGNRLLVSGGRSGRAISIARAALRHWVKFGLLWFAAAAGIASADVVPPKVDTTTATGVSIPDAYFRVSSTDLSIGSLALERFSQSRSPYWPDYSQFGISMTSNFDIYVQATAVKATGAPFFTPAHFHTTVHIGNSSVGVFSSQYTNGTGWISGHNVDSGAGILAWSGTAYQFTDKSGNIYTFNPNVSANPTVSGISYGAAKGYTQRIDHIVSPNGRVQQFSYDTNDRLKLVTDSAGYAILFDYGSNGFVTDACAINQSQSYVNSTSSCTGQPLTVSYQYTTVVAAGTVPVPILSGFINVLGQTTSYSYGSTTGAMVACVTPPGYSSCETQLTLGTAGLQQTMADTSVWTFGSDQNEFAVNDPESPADTAYEATMKDPAGKITHFAFAGSSPLQVTNTYGKTTTYKWCCSQLDDVNSPVTMDGTMLTEVDFPEGNKYLAQYGGPSNAITEQRIVAKTGSGLADQVVTYGYDYSGASGTFYDQPTSKVDAKGNQTNWRYTGFGAVASEMLPAPAAGAARPLKLYTYVQKSAYVKDSGGALVATTTQIWMPDSITECQTVSGSGNSTPVCDTSAPQRVTSYEYGADGTANNLLVRGTAVTAYVGSTLTTLRTCFGYDPRGRKISTTTPGAAKANCS